MNWEIITAVLLGIGLSASSGFRVFVPLLATSLATHFGWFPNLITNHFEWMGTWPAIIAFGSASVLEILAYYVPIVDNALDTIATPLAVGAGALLTTSFLPMENEMAKWVLGLIVGGGTAGVVQSGTVLTRLLSSKATLTAGNPVVATGESTAAVTGSVMSLLLPIIAGVIALIVVIFMLRYVVKSWSKWQQMRQQRKSIST